MKRRGVPLWLLRDVPALLGIVFSFWPLVILLITSARRAMLGKKVRWAALDDFPLLLAHAEARLAFALTRQAYRRLGWNPRLVPFELLPACDDWNDSVERYLNYSRALRDMNAVVETYIDSIREQYRISEREVASATAHAPVRAPLATRSKSSLADRRGKWRATSSSRDGGGCLRVRARGPPSNLEFRKTSPNPPQRIRV